MKKKFLLISIVWIGMMFLFTGHSFAAPKKGGHHLKWDRPAGHHYVIDRRSHPADHHSLAARRHGPWHHHRWHHPRFRRHGHPRWHHGRPHRTVVRQINNYYIGDHGYYAPQDHFRVDAFVSDTGFSISVGVGVAD